MNDVPSNTREQDGYRLLLLRLDEDPGRATEALSSLRRGLVRFFERHGSRVSAEDAAHETLGRLATRLGDGHEVADVSRFAIGIARNVLREGWRRDGREARGLLEMSRADHGASDDGAEFAAYERCLRELSPDKRALLEDYYRRAGAGKHDWREQLAARRGVTLNALRIQVFRLREELRRRLEGSRSRGER